MPDTLHKALALNDDDAVYGTVAEIGAGQEVARWFFRAGGASKTLAETISAYDKVVSDARYGAARRYVSRERLLAMLEQEYERLLARLGTVRGDRSRFFAFADTVATRSPLHGGTGGDAWLGVRFQHAPGAPHSDVVVHARLLDAETVRQQDAVGVLGLNLIHGACLGYATPAAMVPTLIDGLHAGRVEVDVVDFSGPAFAGVDDRLMSLVLVQHGLTSAAMFTAAGEVVQPSEVLYKRPVVVERGSFRPVTNLAHDILEKATAQVRSDPALGGAAPVVIAEMTLYDLTERDAGGDHRDFVARAETLCALGYHVLVSNFGRFFRLVDLLSQYTDQHIAVAMGLPTLVEVVDGQYYADLPGGVLESIGRLFKNTVSLLVYPQRDDATGAIRTVDDVAVDPAMHHLMRFLRETNRLQPIAAWDPAVIGVRAEDVRRRIAAGDPSWEGMVPRAVAERIRREGLFGCAQVVGA